MKLRYKGTRTLAKLVPVWTIVCLSLFAGTSMMVRAAESSTTLHTNVIDIDNAKLTPAFWQQLLQQQKSEAGKQVLMTEQQIQAFNEKQFARASYLKTPLSFPDRLAANTIVDFIRAISKPSKSPRFYRDGTKLSEQHYQAYDEQMNLQNLSGYQPVRFAIVTHRTSLRTYPTLDRVFNEKMDFDLDRFQETGAFPGEPLAVVHTSKDGHWHFVRSYNYRAWVQDKDLAFASRDEVQAFIDAKQRLIVTGDKVFTAYNPELAQTSEVQLDMGVSLPLLSHKEYGKYQLHRQNPYAGYLVNLPTRDANGKLQLEATLIPRHADVNIGFLPFTQENLINQAFKFLGERYGWGHDYNARDCTGFVGEIYKTFGILMPRNSGQQGHDSFGENLRFDKSVKAEQKLEELKQLEVGDLLYLPGHVAMFLGYHGDKPYIIHDVHGMGYVDHKGKAVSGMLNGVSVTPLLPFKGYIKSMYNIKRIR
ncbi:C40 family peptidase [Thalassotalea mangrovi]|nr:SH3 domain-containing protein [Thalassotalea mangrovi]